MDATFIAIALHSGSIMFVSISNMRMTMWRRRRKIRRRRRKRRIKRMKRMKSRYKVFTKIVRFF